jgi:hypothetical protein
LTALLAAGDNNRHQRPVSPEKTGVKEEVAATRVWEKPHFSL